MDLSTLGLGKNRVSVPIENMRMIAHHLPGKKRMITLLCMMERAIQEKYDRATERKEEMIILLCMMERAMGVDLHSWPCMPCFALFSS